MNEEQFKRMYIDTHTELQLTEALEKGAFGKGSLVKSSDGDKNITKGKIPGKNLIEREALEKRKDKLNHMLLDAVAVKTKDILDIPVERLIGLVIKSLPHQVEGKYEHEFTFADMVKKANIEVETYETIDEQVQSDT